MLLPLLAESTAEAIDSRSVTRAWAIWTWWGEVSLRRLHGWEGARTDLVIHEIEIGQD